MIERLRLDADESGYTLILSGDLDLLPSRVHDGALALRLPADALYEFLDSREVEYALDHRAEGERVRRERAVVLGDADSPDAYEADDPKHPGYADGMAAAADHMKDRLRG